MGLLSEGSPLNWAETKKHADHVRRCGIKQFINLFHKLKDRTNDELKWGDEVEYMLLKIDDDNKIARLLLNADPILKDLQKAEQSGKYSTLWRPEYASYMIEGTPGHPYGSTLAHFNLVESNMQLRREEVLKRLAGAGETAMSLTAFPRLGCPPFTLPEHFPTPNSGAACSLFFPDEATYGGHPRFRTLTANIRERRGENQAINIPIYKDTNTPDPFIEDLAVLGDDGSRARLAMPDHVYMDCMGFGMGCSCLQMTFQACNIDEARILYDQLTPLCPILLALSAACPIQRGYLVDTDCRWNIIAGSVDDRTREERGLEPLRDSRFVIPKSRYDSVDSYLSAIDEPYNDVNMVIDEEFCKELNQAGIDPVLAKHFAHLFIRDPISLFSEKASVTDETDTDHFENIQSTNWQTMRFKPPPPNSSIGWRVEFRPTEVQLTDFENAAYAVFIVLLTRVILSFKLRLVIPISKVDHNMNVAQKRDAVSNEKFYFRKDMMTCQTPKAVEEFCCCSSQEDVNTDASASETARSRFISECGENIHSSYSQLTINEIINGKPEEFVGLVPLLRQYLESVEDIDVDTSCTIAQYLDFIENRASGKLLTTAQWMRNFVLRHPDYKKDSVVSDRINYDLMKACAEITHGGCDANDLLPSHCTKTKQSIPSAVKNTQEHLEEMTKKLKPNVNDANMNISPI